LKNQNAVIATGGGTPCFHDNMKWMNEHGSSLYLKVSPEILFQRLKSVLIIVRCLQENRRKKFNCSLLQLFMWRERFYLQATLVIKEKPLLHILFFRIDTSAELIQFLFSNCLLLYKIVKVTTRLMLVCTIVRGVVRFIFPQLCKEVSKKV
jgi:shikimate kinase